MKPDTLLKADVYAELAWDPSVGNPTAIGVAVKDGVVTLSGEVDTLMQKHAAELAVRRVAGVRGIAMDLAVKLAANTRTTDADIVHSALSALRWHSLVPNGRVTVDVDDGHVTLRGEVEWAYQSVSAEQCVRPLVAVKSVTNEIQVRPHVRAVDLASEISAAFTRHALREAKHIAVDVDAGVVTLRGMVDSLQEKDAAIGTAWRGKGVTRVVDQLEVRA
ncbi:MAG TPA: BON domain-containing protein [Acidovorax sp.]|nr:BON domain-containing protein [Acidovorax sp.]